MTKRNLTLLVGVLLFVIYQFQSGGISFQKNSPLATPPPKPAEALGDRTTAASESAQTVLVTRVIDGDTIEIEGGKKVRYIGINTPETVDPRRGVECFGKEASSKNKELVEGKQVKLEKDVSETDRYGRLLRYVYLGNEFINDQLVKEGYAYASTYPPDVAYQSLFTKSQQEAVAANRGLWGKCKT